jgi:hypothetical protein
MKILKFNLLTIALAFIAVAAVHAQTVDEIIAKTVDALGGKEKINSITSVYMENAVEVMGNEAPSTTVILNGKGAKTKSDFNGQTMVQCYTDKGGWMINPMAGSNDATAMPDDQYKAGKSQIFVGDPFMDYAAKGNKVELLGKDKLQDADVYKIKVTTADNMSTTYFIDANTYYVIQAITSVEMMGQKMEVTSKLSDYEKTDFGYVLPKTNSVSYGEQFSLVIKLKKVAFNQPVDPKIFELGNMN